MMLGTMMTVFVRLHYSYKPGVNSGDVGTMMTVFVRLHYSYKSGVNSGDIRHNDDSICKITCANII
jgi:hypothetical protein